MSILRASWVCGCVWGALLRILATPYAMRVLMRPFDVLLMFLFGGGEGVAVTRRRYAFRHCLLLPLDVRL